MSGPPKALRFRIDGTWWRWLYKPLKAYWGYCDYSRRVIAIDTGHDGGRDLLDTEIHEALHALQAFATEEHTTEVAGTLASILFELGYRKTQPLTGRAFVGK